MTNKEAIEIIERMKQSAIDFHDPSWLKKKASKDILKAYDMAIEALKKEPCEDAISRQAALDDSGLAEFHRYDDYCKMRNYIKSLPSVSVAEKVGE